MNTLGERIVSAREGKGITKREFAQMLGMSESGLYLYEHDRRKPMEAVIQTMASLTGVNFRWLNSGQGEMYGETEDLRSVEDERILRELSPKEKETLLKFLELDKGDRRNIRIYLNSRIEMIQERYAQKDEEEA